MTTDRSPSVERSTGRSLRETTRAVLEGLLAVAIFLTAIRFMGTATETLQPLLEGLLDTIVTGDPSALGAAWVVSYVLMNGSVVAALALSLFTAGLLSDPQLYLMVAGSRLGAAAIVILIGALDYVADRDYSLRRATSLGILTFVVTHSIYLPATIIGYGLLTIGQLTPPIPVGVGFRAGGLVAALTAIAEALTNAIGAGPVFVLALALLVVSLRVFNGVLDRVETERVRTVARLTIRRPWIAVLLGLLVTAATTSVAFSLGVVVPLYNRGYVRRRHMVGYILGANIGTLSDTVIVAIVLESSIGAGLVLALVGVAGALTVLAVFSYERYLAAIAPVHDRIVGDPRAFVAVLVALIIVPLALIGIR